MSDCTIAKVLSANDTGETGGHQAGLLIPREKKILSFFPELSAFHRNPRAHLRFEDQSGHLWEFAFIYYNNRFFGGTRNEYRLTRMTKYIREAGLQTGDKVVMRRDTTGDYSISYHRAKDPESVRTEDGTTVLKLGSGWRVIGI